MLVTMMSETGAPEVFRHACLVPPGTSKNVAGD